MNAQQSSDTISNYSALKRNLSFSGLLQTRYIYNTTDNVDVNGVHSENSESVVNNSFNLRRVRLQVKSQINDRWDAAILVNFAEFSASSSTGKVLENAYVRYSHSPALKIMAGQFRPYFGVEDIIAADFTRSFDFSNGYSAFGKSNWQGYQPGVTVLGSIGKEMPLRYFAGVYNGNGKTIAKDSDNAKNAYLRLETEYRKVKLGINAATGSMSNAKGNAFGADLQGNFPLPGRFDLDVVSEYKVGTNLPAYAAAETETASAKDYKMKNWYVTPLLKYHLNDPRLRSLDFSARYEYLDENAVLSPNARRTLTPLVGLEFSDDYFALLQLGAILENFDRDIPNSSQFSHNMLLAQLQVKF